MERVIRQWQLHCLQENKDMLEFSVTSIIDFLDDCFCNKEHSFDVVDKSRQTLLKMHRLGGDFLCKADENYLLKFMNACFNCHLPIKRKSHNKTWDVNLVLDYLTNLGANSDLTHNVLAGKCILLILLSIMCCRAVVMQL